MDWLLYLLEANAYLCVCYAFYCFFLRRETFYGLNRWYLIAVSIAAFLLPLLTIEQEPLSSFPIPAYNANDTGVATPIPVQMAPSVLMQQVKDMPHGVAKTDTNKRNMENLLLTGYLLIVFLFLSHVGMGLYRIVATYRQGKKTRCGTITHVLLTKSKEAFSFFNWLFYHPQIGKNAAILVHEMVHIRQRHSMDRLFFELLRAFNWFNPLVHLLLRDVRLNHEYIADKEAVRWGTSPYGYAHMLLEHAFVRPSHPLSHSVFNQSQLERRIQHLGRESSNKKVRLRYALALPLMCLLFFFSAFVVDKEYAVLKLHRIPPLDGTSTWTFDNSPPKPRPVPRYEPQLGKPPAHDPNLAKNMLARSPLTYEKAQNPIAEGVPHLYKDYMLHWTVNKENTRIRHPRHSLSYGSEAQLFRGELADTLYVDEGYYAIHQGTVKVMHSQIKVGFPSNRNKEDKKLLIIDPFKRKVMHILDKVDIRTDSLINLVMRNPDIEERKKYPYVMGMQNIRIREARITHDAIISNDGRYPEEDGHQPSILW